ncbi:MAG: GLUG motif-containing protein [Rikenellaceae bacterium]
MKIKFYTLIPLCAAIALFFSSCSKDDGDNSPEQPTTPTQNEYKYLSDYNSTDYPTETNTWTIYDKSASASDFAGLREALESRPNRSITVVLNEMEVIPSAAFTQIVEFTNMQITVSAPAATTVESGAFANCYNLIAASLPKLTTVSAYTFGGNESTFYSFNTLELASDEGVSLSEINSNAFGDLPLSDITLTVGDSNLDMVDYDYKLTVDNNTYGAFNSIIVKRYNPIEIDSVEELTKIGNGRYYYLYSDSYLLTEPIEFTGSWTPIGNNTSNLFSGTFDGNNMAITGLTVSSGTYRGLFGCIYGATIKNVVIENPTISGGTYSGALVGYIQGESTIENCTVSGGSIATSTSSGMVGGLIGRIFANDSTITISSCSNSSNVSSTNTTNVGGLVGRANTEYSGSIAITKCYNNGHISTTNSSTHLGGIAGQTDAYSTGAISITGCYNNGTISGNCYNAGGIAGLVSSNTGSATITVTSSYNSGYVSATSASGYCGGVIGCELPLVTHDVLSYNSCYFIYQTYGVDLGVGNSTSYSEMKLESLDALNAVVNTMNSAIKAAGYSDVSYTANTDPYLPSLMGEEIEFAAN